MSKWLIGFAFIALCAISAQAVPLTWYLEGVTFADGSTASGSFVYDADTNTYSNISITTTKGATYAVNTFSFADPGSFNSSLDLLTVTLGSGDLTGTPALALFFSTPLTDAGGTVPIPGFGIGTCADSNCSVVRSPFVLVTAGVVTTVPPAAASVYFTTYYSSTVASAPDETLRIVNDGGNSTPTSNLWASIYVFDDSEELTQCCSCKITADGLLSESVKLNLTANPIRGIINSRGVIKVISSSTESDVTTGFAPNTPAPGLRVWMTHIQGTKVTLSPGNPVNPVVASPYFVTETEAAPSNLSAGEQTLLQNLCQFDNLLSGKPCTCQPEDYDY
jgi:hypothetical protein